ncbi:hypothetical protein Patl1_03419 [Pistacia atlantica]|uniref:Uncharacterized protein n=1 Tax=Pistacia atlantica TaxID=434234 RepID=A0ACC1C5J4_9ROSI|nr:hypothetical protein Patl1_03419 [Pistacia atlantica]
MAKKLVQYSVVDAFTDSPFKGNPAAVCLLDEDRDEDWLQSVALEFNISETCYLTCLTHSESDSPPRFRLRWFTPVAEFKLCGHATLAAAHSLFSRGLVKSNAIEFETLSGILTAKKALNVSTIIDMKITTSEDIFVVLPAAKSVVELQPQFYDIQKCPGRGIIVSGQATSESGFDFYSRFFCPKFGVNEKSANLYLYATSKNEHIRSLHQCKRMFHTVTPWLIHSNLNPNPSFVVTTFPRFGNVDPVCGSAHCALAPYWSRKLGKNDFVAYAASPRSGVLNIHLDEQNQRVLLRGKAVTVMEGSLLLITLTPEMPWPTCSSEIPVSMSFVSASRYHSVAETCPILPNTCYNEEFGLDLVGTEGDEVPPSAFSMTNCGEWDKFRNIDMDKEVHVNAEKIAVLNAWHRVDCRTREALRRSFLSELIEGYEDCIRAFIKESGDGDRAEGSRLFS